MSQIRHAGSGAIFAGIVALVFGAFVGAAGAVDEGDFQDAPGFSVSASRSYDPQADETTFTFTLSSQTGERASQVVLASCPEGTAPISTTGPGGAEPATGNSSQPATGDHVGVKYEPGDLGTYTVTFAGDVAAQFIVKSGPGHRHFFYGPPCEDGTQATTSTSPSTTTTTTTAPTTTTTTTTDEGTGGAAEETTTTTAPATTTTAPATTTTAPTTTTTGSAEVGGAGEERTTTTTAQPTAAPDGAEVMGETEERADQLPRTGPGAATALAGMGVALVLGGFSLRCAAARH